MAPPRDADAAWAASAATTARGGVAGGWAIGSRTGADGGAAARASAAITEASACAGDATAAGARCAGTLTRGGVTGLGDVTLGAAGAGLTGVGGDSCIGGSARTRTVTALLASDICSRPLRLFAGTRSCQPSLMALGGWSCLRRSQAATPPLMPLASSSSSSAAAAAARRARGPGLTAVPFLEQSLTNTWKAPASWPVDSLSGEGRNSNSACTPETPARSTRSSQVE
mmetsp:Transcript_75392/g.194361  ORF Transcript_75392/g.194361 Transcript_75392/m.194361 type:complete len:227 (+) Transcript_75392:810-1490(+)